MGPLRDEQGNGVDDDRTMSEMLNKFFRVLSSIRSDNSDRVNMSPGVSDDHVNTGENELWITEELILEHIGMIIENNAAGADELGSTLIRKLAGELALPLMMIFRKSMQLRVVPEKWKGENVTAIF